MMKDEWKFTITEAERLWLQTCYSYMVEGKPIVVRTIRASLFPKLPGSFNPQAVDRLLLVGGGQITLLGVLQIEDSTPYYSLCEQFISNIQKLIIENPSLTEVKPEMIPDLDPKVMLNLMSLIGHMGSFWRGYTGNPVKGVVNITVGDDDVYNEYLNYESLEAIIDRHLAKHENEEKFHPENSLYDEPYAIQKVHPYFSSNISSVDKKLAFVLMPFTQSWSDSVWETIRDAVESLGIQCLRADSLYGPIVIEDIWIKINQCAFVIADVTGPNPNVMYEMGLVHALGKHAILLCQDTEHIPFDFRHLRHFFYKTKGEKPLGINAELKKAIRHIYQEYYPGIIPIT